MYQEFYNLEGKPFQLTPDPALLFPSKGHQRAMSYLMYGFEQGEGFVMITGAVGTGKTLLIQALCGKLSNRNMVMASIASANLHGSDVLPAVAAALNLPFEGYGKEALLQALRQHLRTLQVQRTRALLVVDEAQTMTAGALEMLRVLSNWEVNGRALLQVFLVGQTELRHTIISHHMEQLRQRVIASYRLEPMQQDETCAYIQHRLRAVGWKNDPQLSQDIFPGVQRVSSGIPRKINLIMDRLLLYGYLEELHTLDRRALATVLAEMQEEAAGLPPSLEAPVTLRGVGLARTPKDSEERGADRLTVLEVKLNDILRQLREKARLKEMLQSSGVSGERTAGTGAPEVHRLRRERESK